MCAPELGLRFGTSSSLDITSKTGTHRSCEEPGTWLMPQALARVCRPARSSPQAITLELQRPEPSPMGSPLAGARSSSELASSGCVVVQSPGSSAAVRSSQSEAATSDAPSEPTLSGCADPSPVAEPSSPTPCCNPGVGSARPLRRGNGKAGFDGAGTTFDEGMGASEWPAPPCKQPRSLRMPYVRASCASASSTSQSSMVPRPPE